RAIAHIVLSGSPPQAPPLTREPRYIHPYVPPTMGANSMTSASPTSEAHAIERSMNAIRSIVRAQRINTRAVELKMGSSLAQLFVLQQLAERSADSLNELAERTATHQSSVSVVVRRLVERGLVARTAG